MAQFSMKIMRLTGSLLGGNQHPRREVIGRAGLYVRGRQVERNNPHLALIDLLPEPSPVSLAKAAKAIDLLDPQYVAWAAIRQQAKQFGACKRRAAFVLHVGRGDGQPLRGGKSL